MKGIHLDSLVTLPAALDPNITKFCYDIEQKTYSILTKRKARNNLSRQEIAALKSLKSNGNIIIKKSDKG